MRRLLWLACALLLAACAAPAGRPQVDQATKPVARVGVIESVGPYDVPAEGGNAGGFLGGLMGNIGGAVLGGGGRGSAAGAVLGGTLGGNAGHAAQNSGAITGQEIWVRLEGKNDPLVIIQSVKAGEEFKVGERVRVVRDTRGRDKLERDPAKDAAHP